MITAMMNGGVKYPNSNTCLLIVINGESNSGGYALNSQALSSELLPQSNVKILNNTTMLFENLDIGTNNIIDHAGLAGTDTHGFELELSLRVNTLSFYSKKPVFLVKTGHGGSKIDEWNEGGTYWTKFTNRVNAAKAILTALGYKIDTLVLYSQGINDAISNTPTATWKTATLAHFEKIRVLLGQRTPIVMTKFMSNYAAYNTAIDELIMQKQRLYAVITSDASLRDSNHWDYAGMKLVAGRMLLLLESRSIN